jgi:hypothetical protein
MRSRVALAGVTALLAVTVAGGSATAAGAGCARTPMAAPPAAPASDAQVSAYLRRVDRRSDRVRTGVLGRSVRGRELPYAIVSSAGNVARVGSIAARLRAVRDGAVPPRALARDQPAIVWLAGGVHGNEPSGTDADLRVLRALATGGSAAACAQLAHLVVVIVPVQNPDGRAAFTRVNANGFDLNRDWFTGSQPETIGRLALLRAYPPIALDDQHEQGGTEASTPPNAPPILPVLPTAALRALRERFAPALHRALHPTGRAFDLLYPGYADSASTALVGAAGMTVEVGSAAPYAVRMAQHEAAAQAVLAVAQHDRRALLRAWAGSRRDAATRPARTFLLAPGAAAATLAGRLEAGGVRVRQLAAPIAVPAFRAFGSAQAAPAALPAETLAISTAQPARAWVRALLEEDAGGGLRSTYDDTSWSNPLLMGIAGGWTDAPVAAVAATLAPPPTTAAPVVSFAGDSLGGLALATRLLARGAAVARVPVTGELTATGFDPATLAALAAQLHVAVRAADAPPAGAVALRVPRVALLDDLERPVHGPPGEEDSGRRESRAWMAYLLRDRLGVAVSDLSPARAATLDPATTTALVVADGEGELPAAALTAIGAYARAGGTVVAVGDLGLALVRGAGLTPIAPRTDTGAFASAGATFAVAVDPVDPLAWGAGSSLFVLDAADPVLSPAPPGAVAVAAHPDAPRLVAGFARGIGALSASPVVVDQPVGAGRLALFAADPAYRASVDGLSRLLVNALLAPAPSAGAGARRSAASRRSAPRR